MTWIQTHSGVAWDLHTPVASKIRLDDIAYALSHINRFTGHAGSYSVAQHSIHVYERVAQLHQDRHQLQLAALLHDAHEAYLSDLSTPLKATMPPAAREWWEALRDDHDNAIAEWAGLPSGSCLSAGAIKSADRELLATERRDLMGPCDRAWASDLPEPLEMRIDPWSAYRCLARFTITAERLMREVSE